MKETIWKREGRKRKKKEEGGDRVKPHIEAMHPRTRHFNRASVKGRSGGRVMPLRCHS